MIAVLDESAAYIYLCDTESEANMVRRMLDLVGAEHKTLTEQDKIN